MVSDPGGAPVERDVRWGHHPEFPVRYEMFLDAVYGGEEGRRRLADSIAGQLGRRGAMRVLDCAAGTGFPTLELATGALTPFEIRCCDRDPAMVAVLARRAAGRGIPLRDLTPQRRPGVPTPQGTAGLVIDWARLRELDGRYDYVLCRGNALAYADTWTGGRRVASEARIETYLAHITAMVRPGGWLHIDAPWRLGLPTVSHRLPSESSMSIWEQVSVQDDCREWWVSFKPHHGGPTISFKRYSSLLTIDRIAVALGALGFEETTPFQLTAERPGFGVIIARKPGALSGPAEPDRVSLRANPTRWPPPSTPR